MYLPYVMVYLVIYSMLSYTRDNAYAHIGLGEVIFSIMSEDIYTFFIMSGNFVTIQMRGLWKMITGYQ